MKEIPTRYNPKAAEDKWYEHWEKKGFFHAQPNPQKKPYTIVIPPPNITGILHMGHALNNTVQDILIRYKRMQGFETEWMPGTDHAGIATQNVVEKELAKEGTKRHDVGREKFLERAWKWREEYGSTIIMQLKKLGCSCDWERVRFTMDPAYSKAVMHVFVRLWEKGLIYQDNKVINWCPRCGTALADEEAPRHEVQGNLYYLKYPFKDNPEEFVTVATTRPETMLGDTAVAVNPKDKRYKRIIGKTLVLPLINREINVIADEMVDMKFGTGAVKVTPAHDPNDDVLGKKHNLAYVNILYPDARLNDNAGDYRDMDRFEAREVILEDLKERGLLAKVEPHQLAAGHCYRCHTIIEPYLSKQWFVKMKPLAKPAIEAVKKGNIKFHPKRWTKVYLNWMENIQDWCISRQIWWGHRIPLWYCDRCASSVSRSAEKNTQYAIRNTQYAKGIIVSGARPEKCPACDSTELEQDEDVLDTWFSSWLWPFATFGWPEKAPPLDYFYPTDCLVTAQEIIFFWVARMIMAGFEFMGAPPFSDVYIHGTVRDDTGKKMSKSLGNIIDPLEIIDEFGCDALRFSLMSITATGQDVFLSKKKFEIGRNFANKLWNASRFIIMNLSEDVNVDLCQLYQKESLDLPERWILSRLYHTIQDVTKSLDAYRFNEAAAKLYEFIWHEFCDWYIEFSKMTIQSKHTQIILYKVLEKSLRMLHPFMPFVTEEIWSNLPHERSSVMVESLPHVQKKLISTGDEKNMDTLIGMITALRNIRQELGIPHSKKIQAVMVTKDTKQVAFLERSATYVKKLAGVETMETTSKLNRQTKQCASAVVKDISVYVPLAGLIDIDGERKRLQVKIDELNGFLKSTNAKLKNKNFVAKAPKNVVAKEEEKQKTLKDTITKLKKNVAMLR
jgi:valyl-tRNA synthetase